MMGHVVLDVFLKFAFNAPLIGTLETVSYYYMVGAVFLPLGAVELKKEHVHVDLFIQFFFTSFKVDHSLHCEPPRNRLFRRIVLSNTPRCDSFIRFQRNDHVQLLVLCLAEQVGTTNRIPRRWH